MASSLHQSILLVCMRYCICQNVDVPDALPTNMAIMAGDRSIARFNCSPSNHHDTDVLEWRWFPYNMSLSNFKDLYRSEIDVKHLKTSPELHASRAGNQFLVIEYKFRHDLLVRDVKAEYAGGYQCSILAAARGSKGELVVIENFSVVSKSVSMPDTGTFREGDRVEAVCSVNATGYMAPKLQWKRRGVPVGTDYQLHGNNISVFTIESTMKITATPEHNDQPFICELFFSQDGARTDKVPTFQQQLPYSLNVLFSPRNLVLSVEEEDLQSLKVGDVVRCSAEGNPEPAIFWYEKGVREKMQMGKDLVISSDLAGRNSYPIIVVCLAKSIISHGGVEEYEKELEVAITVRPTTETPSSTPSLQSSSKPGQTTSVNLPDKTTIPHTDPQIGSTSPGGAQAQTADNDNSVAIIGGVVGAIIGFTIGVGVGYTIHEYRKKSSSKTLESE